MPRFNQNKRSENPSFGDLKHKLYFSACRGTVQHPLPDSAAGPKVEMRSVPAADVGLQARPEQVVLVGPHAPCRRWAVLAAELGAA